MKYVIDQVMAGSYTSQDLKDFSMVGKGGSALAEINASVPGGLPDGLEARVQAREAEIGFCRVAGRNQRKTVARRSGDQIQRACRFEQREKGVGRGERAGRRQAAIEEQTPVLEPAHVDTDGAGIDAYDARHAISARCNSKCKMQNANRA